MNEIQLGIYFMIYCQHTVYIDKIYLTDKSKTKELRSQLAFNVKRILRNQNQTISKRIFETEIKLLLIVALVRN